MAEIEGDSAFMSGVRFAMIPFGSPDETTMALQLRPNCEYCDKDLPPSATEARICSYECTFCADCAESKLGNVCPNCGGGFVPRPIRPSQPWRAGVCVTAQLPSDNRVHLKYSLEDIAARYIGEIQDRGIEGPYNFFGYSFGGLVAFEMAQQLSRSLKPGPAAPKGPGTWNSTSGTAFLSLLLFS